MARIRGRVTDANGVGLPGLQVTANPGGGGNAVNVQTDAQGNYDFGNIAAGGYALSVQAPVNLQNPVPLQINLAANQVLGGQDFQLQPAAAQPGTIAGVVTDQANVPVANAAVTATDAAGVAQPGVQTKIGRASRRASVPTAKYDV